MTGDCSIGVKLGQTEIVIPSAAALQMRGGELFACSETARVSDRNCHPDVLRAHSPDSRRFAFRLPLPVNWHRVSDTQCQNTPAPPADIPRTVVSRRACKSWSESRATARAQGFANRTQLGSGGRIGRDAPSAALCPLRHRPMVALVGADAAKALRVLEVLDMLLDRTAGNAKRIGHPRKGQLRIPRQTTPNRNSVVER